MNLKVCEGIVAKFPERVVQPVAGRRRLMQLSPRNRRRQLLLQSQRQGCKENRKEDPNIDRTINYDE